MKPSSRIYSCLLCHCQVYICSYCDRGNIYCSHNCSKTARKIKTRLSGQRYQKSYKGKVQHAKRQAQYRRKKASSQNKVTHHGSPPPINNVLLQSVENKAEQDEIEQTKKIINCHFCKNEVSDLFRTDFLRHRSQLKPQIISSYSQPP